ncbi:MAG: DUF4974 domain-containing protein [Cyclobacteriaceae bacterium]|nr:DUF4974 domain-containing protein [Cyclobacteriaceae bacterium]
MNTNPNFLSWKTQKLVFDNTELKNVIYALSVYYDIKFEVNTPEILNCRFTGSFDNARLNTVMEVLKYSLGIDYSYDHNEYILSGKGCK